MPLVTEEQALQILEKGDVVALPTETVYGLAARVDDDSALTKIFATKERPFFDPLIVHVQNLMHAQAWAHVDSVSRVLADHFWPGPLTLVLEKKDCVSKLINNGGPTVALRSPSHPMFQNLLQKIGTPLAAPSANMFGKTSPTEAQHVIEEFKDKIPVLDGGPCINGIESTVLKVDSDKNQVEILRPGIIHERELNEFLNERKISFSVTTRQSDQSPGHLQNHYQPSSPLILVEGSRSLDAGALSVLQKLDSKNWQELRMDEDPTLAARYLYGRLREISRNRQPMWIRLHPHWKSESLWAGILDRIEKAASGRLCLVDSQWQLILKH